ncbi:MAG: prolyl oligopeptidase family serine peptidase [Bellilinea sp.]
MSDEKAVRPYGLWPSPISASSLAGRPRLEDVQWTPDGNALVWLENRGGQGQLLYQPLGEAQRELLVDHSTHGGVGYGGGEFGLSHIAVYFAEHSGALYRRDFINSQPRRLTPVFGGLASPKVSPDGRWVVYVHSDGNQDVLALVDAEGKDWPVKLVSGADFYMQPTWSPSGAELAWVEWDHPNMPWDATRLKLGKLSGSPPRITSVRLIAGGHGEMVSQPQFSPDGHSLSYIISRGGWEALEVLNLESGQRATWLAGEFDLSVPAWVQGQHSYGWSSFGNRIFILRNSAGKAELCAVDASGKCQLIPTEPYTWLEQLSVSPAADELALIASSAKLPTRIIRWDGDRWRAVAYSDTDDLQPGDLPDAQPVEWETLEGQKVYGLYASPASSRYTGQGAPPLIVSIHGGPTSQSKQDFPREAHYFTSRGYAWLEVNYRGSCGYGRSYRDALLGVWGKLDTEDAVSGAQAMAARRLADGDHMAIFGGSAGGFTVLNALAQFPGVFKAGIALYPVSNLFTLSLETHKFEQHYDQNLIGKLPEAADIYRERSPLFQAGKIKDALAIFHGRDDRAVPLNQSEAIVERLSANRVPHLFHVYEGEGHGFRKPETLNDLYPRIERFLLEHMLFAAGHSR